MRQPRATKSEISAILKAYLKSGKSQQKFCADRGISFWTFRNWLGRTEKPFPKKSSSLPVISFVPSSAPATTAGYRVEFPNGTILHIPSIISIESILTALRGTS